MTESFTYADYHGLAPADGWQAIFRDHDGNIRRERLIGWAVAVIKERVVEHAEEEGQECEIRELGHTVDAILGMVPRAIVEPAEWQDDFLCYAHKDETLEEIDDRLTLIEASDEEYE